MATLRELVERMATDAAFATEVRADPDRIGLAHRLSAVEIDMLRSLTDGSSGGPEALAERLSKSGLSFGGGLMGLLGTAEIIGPDDPGFSDSSSTGISDSTMSGPIDADPGGLSTESDSALAPPQKVSVPALPTMSGHSLLGPDTSSLGPAMAVPAGIVGADYATDGEAVAILCNARTDDGVAAILCCARDDEGLAMIQCCARDDEGVVAIQCNDRDSDDVAAISCNGARDGVSAIECNGFVDGGGVAAIQCNAKESEGVAAINCGVVVDGQGVAAILCSQRDDEGGAAILCSAVDDKALMPPEAG